MQGKIPLISLVRRRTPTLADIPWAALAMAVIIASGDEGVQVPNEDIGHFIAEVLGHHYERLEDDRSSVLRATWVSNLASISRVLTSDFGGFRLNVCSMINN